MKEMMIILVSAILVDNFVLSKFMGCCPFLGVSRKVSSAFGMSVAVTLVMLMATAVTHPIYTLLLAPNGLEYMQTIVFILVIALFVQLVEIILKRFVVSLYKALGVYLALITTNCAVLGVTLLNITGEYTFAQAMVNALGAGLGFMLAMMLFSGVRQKLESCNIPKAFQGVPITLIAASIVSIAFLGFDGIVEGMFQ